MPLVASNLASAPAPAAPAPTPWPAGNLFQGVIDRVGSPLLTTPAPAPLQKALPAAASVPGKPPDLGGGLNLGHLLARALGEGSGSSRPAALPAPVQTTPAAAAGQPGWVQGVVRAANQAGVNPTLAVAIALEESGGNPKAVGDQGTSFGLYQLHKGGALGSMSSQAAFDPYQNAMAVLPAWGKIGGGRGLSDEQALMQYYHGVGRGASDTIPTRNALAKLDQAKALVQGAGGQTLAERVTGGGVPGVGGLSQGAFGALLNYASKIQKDSLAGRAPDMGQIMRMVDPIMKAIMAPTQEVQAGQAPPVDPGTSGRDQIATQAALGVLGTPYSWGGGGVSGPSRGIDQGANTTGFDCSALVQYAWAKAGVMLPRTTYGQMNAGVPVPNLAAARPGDLLFPEPGHVMMYLGNGMAVESPHTGLSVREVSVAGRTFFRIRRPG